LDESSLVAVADALEVEVELELPVEPLEVPGPTVVDELPSVEPSLSASELDDVESGSPHAASESVVDSIAVQTAVERRRR
jgi:hypothetical protein